MMNLLANGVSRMFGQLIPYRKPSPPKPVKETSTGRGLVLDRETMLRIINNMRSRAIMGPTGSGKTNFVQNEIVTKFDEGDYWMTYVDPHGEAAEHLISQLYAMYGESLLDRLVVERLCDNSAVIMREYITRSNAVDPFDRMSENELNASMILDTAARRRGIDDLSKNPNLERYGKLAIAAKQYCDPEQWFPDHAVPLAILPNSDEWRFAIQYCTNAYVREKLRSLKFIPGRDRMNSNEAAERLLSSILRSPPIFARTCNSQIWNKVDHHNKCGLHIIIGGGVSDDALRCHVLSDFQQTVRLARARLIRPGIYIRDESLNYGLFGEYEAKCAATMRVFGLFTWDLMQYFNYPTPAIQAGHLGNTDHYWFRQDDHLMAEYAANDLRGLLDPMTIHHVDRTERQRVKGHRFIPRISTGESWSSNSEDDGRFTSSTNYGESMIPEYEQYTEERASYYNANDLVFWKAADIRSMPIGSYFFVSPHQRPGLRQAPLFADQWCFPGLAEQKFHECLEEVMAAEIYEQPILTQFPPPGAVQAQTHMAKKGRKK